jgi:hypothetical protein
VNVNADAAPLSTSTGIGAIFEVVPTPGASNSVVAEADSNTAGFKTADAVLASYLSLASTGK